MKKLKNLHALGKKPAHTGKMLKTKDKQVSATKKYICVSEGNFHYKFEHELTDDSSINRLMALVFHTPIVRFKKMIDAESRK